MSFLTMLDEITLKSLTKEQFECFIEYYRKNYPEDYKSDLENLKEVYKMMNGGVEYPRTQNASPSEIKKPYEPSPKTYSYEQPSCLGSTFVGETHRKSDQLHQTFEKSSIAMTRKLYDMIELPKSQPKRTYNEDLECEIVMVKTPKCMAWLDDVPIGFQGVNRRESREEEASELMEKEPLGKPAPQNLDQHSQPKEKCRGSQACRKPSQPRQKSSQLKGDSLAHL
ncbi:hypothetical protein Tco_1533918 [Tanacetum coccineum]